MACDKISITLLFLLTTTGISAYAHHGDVPEARRTVRPPTARNFAYPQSLFVDSQNGNIWVTDFDNNRVMRFDVSSLTNVFESVAPLREDQYTLGQNYPNPFNPSTTMTFAVRNTGCATIKVYDLLGREVATLFEGTAEANELYRLSFNAAHLPSGVYFCRLRSENRTEVRKMGVLK